MGDNSYIGNCSPEKLFPPNLREELFPDPGSSKVTFLLQQEVPGGYEHNILVIINNVIQDPDDNSYTITGIGSNKNRELNLNAVLESTDKAYVIHRGSATVNVTPSEGSVTPAALSFNLRNFVKDTFVGDNVETEFLLTQEVAVARSLLVWVNGLIQDDDDLSVGVTGEYRVANQVVLRTQSITPGTYTLDEIVEGQTSGATARFASQSTNEMTLISLDGVFSPGEDIVGQTSLVSEALQTVNFITESPRNILQFITPPPASADIRVLHLGFTTVSRRSNLTEAGLSPGGVGTLELEDGAVTTIKLADDSISKVKIIDDSVCGPKLLLRVSEGLRNQLTDLSELTTVYVDGSDNLVIEGPNTIGTNLIQIRLEGTNLLTFENDKIAPETTNSLDLGTPTLKFKNLYLDGSIDMLPSMTVDGVDVSDLDSRVTVLETTDSNPTGSVIMFSGTVAPSGWELCQGQELDRVVEANLFAVISTTFGAGDGSTTFNVPDMRQNFPVGANDPSAPILGSSGGDWNHTHDFTHSHTISASGSLPDHTHSSGTYSGFNSHSHTVNAHTHSLNNHTHVVPRHFHGKGSLVTANDGFHSHAINTVSGNWAKNSGSDTELAKVGTGSGNSADDTLTGFGPPEGGHSHALVGQVGDLTGNNGDVNNPSGGPSINSTGSATASTTTSNINITISGESGSVVEVPLPDVSVNGSTDSQSITSTDAKNPPYVAFNFIIKK